MSISRLHNPSPVGGGAEELGQLPGFDKDKPDTDEKLLRVIREGALAGLFYGLWGALDAYIPGSIDYTLAEAHWEAAFRGIVVGVPALLLRLRRGMLSALILTAVSLFNIASLLIAAQSADPNVGMLTFLWHLPFTVWFARAALAARQWKKQTGGHS